MLRDLGNAINTFLTIAPTTIGAGSTEASTEGVGEDRLGYEYAVFVFENCQPLGTPLGVTITCVVQESDDNSTYTDISGASTTHNVTNTYTRTELAVNLGGVKRYVRGKMAVQFNGGTGPYVIISAVGILGSASEYPV